MLHFVDLAAPGVKPARRQVRSGWFWSCPRAAGRHAIRARTGFDRPAPRTFASRADAERWLLLTDAEIIRGDPGSDPDLGQVPFADYALCVGGRAAQSQAQRPPRRCDVALVRLHLVSCPRAAGRGQHH